MYDETGGEYEFANPIIDADWPDPDAIRVGDDYYAIASSFTRTPGLPILHSTNLVDWEIVGHAIDRLPPFAHYDLPRPGGGVWAPSLRHQDGVFYIVYPDPDHGLFVVTADDARGPWSAPRLLFSARGAIDPCPLWDDDGRTYLVHAWAPSRSGITNRIDIVEVSSDLRRVISTRTTLIDGNAFTGTHTLEGPKIYKRDGWYWVFAPAGGVATGWQSAFRSRALLGPWEHRIVMAQGRTDVNGPHQGAWVTTVSGEDWFLHFQDRGVFGRVMHLQPMSWTADGWPVIGVSHDGSLPGEPVRRHATPDGLPREDRRPATSDDFRSNVLAAQWSFAATPPPHAMTLAGDGVLRLSVIQNDHGDLRALPQVLTQPLPGVPGECRVFVRAGEVGAPGRAGLAMMGAEYAWVGIEWTDDATFVVIRRSASEATESELAQRTPIDPWRSVGLRLRWDSEGVTTLDWSLAPNRWGPAVGVFAAVPGRWVGAELALFAAAPFGAATSSDRVGFARFVVDQHPSDSPLEYARIEIGAAL